MKRDVIALTGGIGSGKSAVAQILREIGYSVLDCDEISQKISCDNDLLAEVVNLLGENSVKNGVLNRPFVRERIFSDEELYIGYSNLFWGKIKSELCAQIEAATSRTVFVEIAVLDAFEFPWKEIWLVESDRNTRLQRVTARDGVSAQNVENIMSKQNNVGNFNRKIFNDGTLSELKSSVLNILKETKFLI